MREGERRKEEGAKKSKEPPGVSAVQERLPGVPSTCSQRPVFTMRSTWWVWLRRDTFRGAVSTGGREGEKEERKDENTGGKLEKVAQWWPRQRM